MTHSKILLFVVLEEPNFKIYTDCDTPSGDASLLRGHGAAAELSVQHDGAGSTRGGHNALTFKFELAIPLIPSYEP